MEKKSTQLRWLVTMLLLVTAMAMPKMAWAEIALVEPTNGDGTSENPYQITTAAELSWFADKVNNDNANYSSKNAVLIADIDLEGSATNTWKPISGWTGAAQARNHHQLDLPPACLLLADDTTVNLD